MSFDDDDEDVVSPDASLYRASEGDGAEAYHPTQLQVSFSIRYSACTRYLGGCDGHRFVRIGDFELTNELGSLDV